MYPMRNKIICIVSMILLCFNVLQAQTNSIKQDIIQTFKYDDGDAFARVLSSLKDLGSESIQNPGVYEIDTLAVYDIISTVDSVSKDITYASDSDKRLVVDLLYGILYTSIGDYVKAILAYESANAFCNENHNVDVSAQISVLDLLSGVYYENGNYESSLKYAISLNKLIKRHNIQDETFVCQSYMHMARSQLMLGELQSAYKNIKKAYLHPDKEYLSARLSINADYIEILKALSGEAIKNKKYSKVIDYYKELTSILSEYRDINVSSSLDDEFIINTLSAMNNNLEAQEILRYIDLFAELQHEGLMRFNLYDYTLNDGKALHIKSWGEQALNNGSIEFARLCFKRVYQMSIDEELSEQISMVMNSWYAYFKLFTDNDHIEAFNAYHKSLNTALRLNDSSQIEEYLRNILYVLDESTTHIRYFFAQPQIDKGIFVLSFSDTEYLLKQWSIISEQIVLQLGEDFFNKILKAHKDVPKNQRVFPFYSEPDNKLMWAHNLIREADYTKALQLINELIIEESLNNDDVIDLIWRIDNNLYLNTGYKESDLFLQNILEASFVRNRSEVTEWIDRERERIKDWFGHELGYANQLAEDGDIENAMKTYDGILEQVQYSENPDSLYLEVQLMRAVNLCYYAKKYDESLLVSKEVSEMATDKAPGNYLVRSNSLSLIVQSLIKLENYSEALSYCEENINLLKRHKVDDDGHHLLQALQQYGDINLSLKNYDLAEKAYLTCLDNNLEEYNLVILVTNLAQIYYERLEESLRSKNGELCLEMYYKAIDLFKSYPSADAGLSMYFSPFSNRLKDILSIIPQEEITRLCDDIIDLDLLVNGSKSAMGANSEIHPLEWHAHVIQCFAIHFREMQYWREAILYHDKAIEFVIENDTHHWGSTLRNYYTDRAMTKERSGDWVAGVKDRILSFHSSQSNSRNITKEVEESFRELKTSVNLALATKTSYAIAMYKDSLHPHLKYDECLEILELWRSCLNDVLGHYGEEYLSSLQNYLIRLSEESYYEQFNEPMQYSVTDQLRLLSGIDYMKCNLDINENRLNDFNQSFRKLLDNVEPIDETIDVNKLRFDIVKDISSTLSHAGYTDWSFRVLEGYLYDLISNHKDYELAEKVNTEIGILAYNLGDFSRLIDCTRFVNTTFISNNIHEQNYSVELLPFYDINELIQQLILFSRLQKFLDNPDALNTLYYAKELVDGKKCLSNGNYVTSEVAANLYNELAIIEDDSQKSIEYYKKAIEINKKFDYGTTLNLAIEYMNVDNYAEADSLFHIVYDYSKEQYIEPRWKESLYKGLTKCSIYYSDYDKALEYSRERLRIQSSDYLQTSQSLTSAARNNYWDTHYTSTLSDASTTDLACGSNGSNSYNASLFQKSILIRQKAAIKNNIVNCNDAELIKAFDKYNQEIRSHSESATSTEEYCMYLYSLHPEFLSSFSIPRWQEVQENLSRKDLALEFTEAYDEETNESFYAAILLKKDFDYPVIVRLCKKSDLVSLNYNKVDASGFSISMFEDQESLYHLIWEPLEKYLRGVKTIYYSPYEFLNNINVEAAKKKQGAKPIAFVHNMVRVSTTAELLSDTHSSFSNAVVFGDIDYDAPFNEILISEVDTCRITEDNYTHLRGSKHETWKRLMHAAREVDGINKLFRNNDIYTTNYTNDHGTEEAFKLLSGSAPDILHLATHGFYYTSEEAKEHEYFRTSDKVYYDSGVRSGIILTSGNHAWKGKSIPSGSEDGILTANEISGIDLSKTDLVTLSACQTALGDIASDGVYGMQRSFKVAGVNSIIMSLWQVDDEATYLMMEKFYEGLTKGKDKREAFKNAQLFIKEWADQRVKELRNTYSDKIPEIQENMKAKYGALIYPEYYWAAFVMLD